MLLIGYMTIARDRRLSRLRRHLSKSKYSTTKLLRAISWQSSSSKAVNSRVFLYTHIHTDKAKRLTLRRLRAQGNDSLLICWYGWLTWDHWHDELTVCEEVYVREQPAAVTTHRGTAQLTNRQITWILAGPHGMNWANFLSRIRWRLLCTCTMFWSIRST